MAFVRVLKNWRGLRCGIYADVRGQHYRDGVSEGALDHNAPVPEGYAVEVIGEDDEPKAKKK